MPLYKIIFLIITYTTFFLSKSNGQNYSYSDIKTLIDDSTNKFFNNDTTTKLYLIGETHSYKGNGEIEMTLFKALSNKSIKTNLLFEGPRSLKKYYEEYLFGGDTTEFFFLSQALSNPSEDILIFRELRSFFNINGHSSINIALVDIEQNFNLTFYSLKSLFENRPQPPASISEVINEIRSIVIPRNLKYVTKNEYKQYVKCANKLHKSLEVNKTEYENYLDKDYQEIIEIEKSLMIGIRTKPLKRFPSNKHWTIRELAMYDNATKFMNSNKNSHFLGIFGANHTALNPTFVPISIKPIKSLGYYLNENPSSPVVNSVTSFLIVYPKQEVKQANFQLISEQDLDYFSRYFPYSISILNTTIPANSHLKQLKPYFKYIIVNNN